MILGIDASTYLEVLDHGGKYYVAGKAVEPLNLLRSNGVEYMRIRLWNNPYDEQGNSYLGGSCDISNFINLAKLAQSKGYKILLDFHYSDFWVDPAKQCLPKAWRGFSVDQLEQAVYDFTKSTLLTAQFHGIDIAMVQVGNEITNGMLWPAGLLRGGNGGIRENYPNFIRFVKAGIASCREIYPFAKIVLHLERSYDQDVYNEFFGQTQLAKVDYDIIGMSYYPYWHGTFDMFFANVNNCKKFGKQIMAVEFGYSYTLEGHVIQKDGQQIRVAIDNEMVDEYGVVEQYPITKQGQAQFIRDFLARAQAEGLDGVFYWEPLWLAGEGICWSTPTAQVYIGEEGKPTANEVANRCLFDYQGNALPSLEAFSLSNKQPK